MGQQSSQLDGADGVRTLAPTENGLVEVERKPKKKRRNNARTNETVEDIASNNFEGAKNATTKARKRKRRSQEDEGLSESQHVNGNSVDHNQPKKRSSKKQKPTISEAGDHSIEAESALALMQLKGNASQEGNDAADEDYGAASAQLLSEAIRAPVKKSRFPRNNRGEQELKNILSAQEGISHDDTLATPPATQPEFPQSTMSLDTIPSDDEEVASYLQQYEDVANFEIGQDVLPNGDQNADIEERIATATNDIDDYATQMGIGSADGIVWPSLNHSDPVLPETSKKNSKKRVEIRSDSANFEGLDGSNDEGEQHLEIALEGLSKLYGLDLHATNKIEYWLDGELPIDPRLKGGEATVALDGDDDAVEIDRFEQARPSLSKRISKGKKQQRLDGSTNIFIVNGQKQKPGATPSSTRRKRRMPVSAPRSEQSPQPKASRDRTAPPPDYNPTLASLAKHGGPFTNGERESFMRFRKHYCEEHEITEAQFADLVHASALNAPQLTAFWTEICDLASYRTRQSIQKYCRRQFHNFEKRGSWTKEEDSLLRRAVEEKGTRWKVVGEICGRFGEDCRDRYRNYIYNGENRNKEEWTDAEVKALCWAVSECMWLMKEEKNRLMEEQYAGREMPKDDDPDDEAAEAKLINWQVVSDKMEGRRTRLQCLYKWRRLKWDLRLKYMKEYKMAEEDLDALERGEIIDRGGKNSRQWRLQKANKKIANMLPGDKYDLLQAIAHCGADLEENISWKTLGTKQPLRRVWSTIDLKAAWVRMRARVEEADELSYHDTVSKILTKLMDDEPGRLDEHWDPKSEDWEFEADGRRAKGRGKKAKKAKDRLQGSPKKSVLSKEYVEDSASEDRGQENADGRDKEDNEEVAEEDASANVDYDKISQTSPEGERWKHGSVSPGLARKLQSLREA